MARKIVEYVTQSNLRVGQRLREQLIADHFGVSRTPVRGALSLLAEQGILNYIPKQGYSLIREPDVITEGYVALPATEDETLFRDVMRDRFANRLDDQVTITELIRRYAASRSCVIRVLTRMSEDGLIKRGSGQSWIFGPALDSLTASEESFRFRLMIEPAAVLEPGFHADTTLLHRIRQQHVNLLENNFNTVDINFIHEADTAFHEVIAESCHNRFLAQAIRQQTKLRELSGNVGTASRHRLAISCQEHIQILDAIGANFLDKAAELLSLHIRSSQTQRPRVSIRGVPPLIARSGRR